MELSKKKATYKHLSKRIRKKTSRKWLGGMMEIELNDEMGDGLRGGGDV